MLLIDIDIVQRAAGSRAGKSVRSGSQILFDHVAYALLTDVSAFERADLAGPAAERALDRSDVILFHVSSLSRSPVDAVLLDKGKVSIAPLPEGAIGNAETAIWRGQ